VSQCPSAVYTPSYTYYIFLFLFFFSPSYGNRNDRT
jgi:hypothetical protein